MKNQIFSSLEFIKEKYTILLTLLCLNIILFGNGSAFLYDSLNVEFLLNYPAGTSYCLNIDTLNNICYLGSGGSVLVFDITNYYDPQLISDDIKTRGVVEDIICDKKNHILILSSIDAGVEIWSVENTISPTFIKRIEFTGMVRKCCLEDNMLYISSWGEGVYAYDITNPSLPSEYGLYSQNRSITGIASKNDTLYLSDYGNGLIIVDFSNPSIPAQLKIYDTPKISSDIAINDSFAFIADSDSGIIVIDITNIDSLLKIKTITTNCAVENIILDNNLLTLSCGISGAKIIDITNLNDIETLAFFDTPASVEESHFINNNLFLSDSDLGLKITDKTDVTISEISNYNSPTCIAKSSVVTDTLLYLATDSFGIKILDISDENNPFLIGSYDTKSITWNVTMLDSIAFLSAWKQRVLVLNLKNPSSPILLDSIGTSGSVSNLAIKDSLMFVANYTDGILIYDLHNFPNEELMHTYVTYSPEFPVDILLKDTVAIIANAVDVTLLNVKNPYSPVLLNKIAMDGDIIDVNLMDDTILFVARGYYGLSMINIKDPSMPEIISTFNTDGYCYSSDFSNGFLYVADGINGMLKFNVNDDTIDFVEKYSVAVDTAVVNVLAEDRIYLSCENYGLRIFDLEKTDTLSLAAKFDEYSSNQKIIVEDSIVYSLDKNNGLKVFKMFNMDSIIPISNLKIPGYYSNFLKKDDYIYMSNNILGLYIIDISNPLNPIKRGEYNTLGKTKGIFIEDSFAFVADSLNGLLILNILDKDIPIFISQVNTNGGAIDVAIIGNYAYVANGDSGIAIVNISDINSPVFVENFITNGIARKIIAHIDSLSSEKKLYLADGTGGVKIIDASQPENLYLISSYTDVDEVFDICEFNNQVVIADGLNGVKILDVSSPPNINLIGYHDTPGKCLGVDISGNIYTANNDAGIQIFSGLLEIVSPVGGEFYKSMDICSILWTCGFPALIDLDLSQDNGVTWHNIIKATENDGHFEWIIPDTINSSFCKIKVSESSDGYPFDIMDNTFTTDVTKPEILTLMPDTEEVISDRRPEIRVEIDDNTDGYINGWTKNVRMLVDGMDVVEMVTDSVVSYQPTTDMSDSIHIVSMHIEDLSGNERDTVWTFEIDGEVPIITEIYPQPNEYVNESRPSIRVEMMQVKGIKSGLDSCQIKVDGIDVTSSALLSDTLITYTPSVSLRDTVHTVNVYVMDMAGNSNDTLWSFWTDVTKPEILTLMPDKGEVISERRPEIRVEIDDNTDGYINGWTKNVKMLVDGMDVVEMVTDSAVSYQPTTDMSDSIHIVSMHIEDLSGNERDTVWTFEIDGEVPIITEIYPQPNEYVNESRPSIRVEMMQVKGIKSGLDSCQIKVDGIDVTSSALLSDTLITYTPTVSLRDTVHLVNVYVRDMAGNSNDTLWSFWTDVTKPEILGVTPSNGIHISDTIPTFNIQYSEGSGISAIYLNAQNVTSKSIIYADSIICPDFIEFDYGNDSISVKLTDIAGNSSDEQKASFFIDNKGPNNFVLLKPKRDTILLDSVEFYWSKAHDDSGIKRYMFYLNNERMFEGTDTLLSVKFSNINKFNKIRIECFDSLNNYSVIKDSIFVKFALGDIKTFPNPADIKKGQKTVCFSGVEKGMKLEIYDISASLLFEDEIESNYYFFSVNSLFEGVYIWRVLLNDGSYRKGVFGVLR